MADRSDWQDLRACRMAEPGAVEAYGAPRLAFELGRTVRALSEGKDWSQARLAQESETQSAIARFEAGGTVPTLPILERLAHALGAELVAQLRMPAA